MKYRQINMVRHTNNNLGRQSFWLQQQPVTNQGGDPRNKVTRRIITLYHKVGVQNILRHTVGRVVLLSQTVMLIAAAALQAVKVVAKCVALASLVGAVAIYALDIKSWKWEGIGRDVQLIPSLARFSLITVMAIIKGPKHVYRDDVSISRGIYDTVFRGIHQFMCRGDDSNTNKTASQRAGRKVRVLRGANQTMTVLMEAISKQLINVKAE